MSDSLESARISKFRNSFDPSPIETVTLAQALSEIGSSVYEASVCHVRQVLARHGKRAYDKAKTHLSAFTFGGTFAPRRGLDHLQQHSGLLHGDLDHLANVEATKRTICSDPRTAYGFKSPSGQGLKIGVHIDVVADDREYKRIWQVISREYAEHYGVAWDVSGKDVSRLCYASWDPEPYWNPNATVFEVPARPSQESPAPTFLQRLPPTHTTDRRNEYAVRALKSAVQMIQTAVPGTRHHARLRASLLLGGYVGGRFLSYDQAYTVLAQALDGHTADVKKALKTVRNGLAYGMAHPITLTALEDERQAWLDQHCARNRRMPMNGDRQEALDAPVSDPWEASQTLPVRPYTGYTGYRSYHSYQGVSRHG
jgi:hypothetical protein